MGILARYFCFLLLLAYTGQAQITFQKNYGAVLPGKAARAHQTPDGGYIAAANHTYGHLLLKINAQGDTIWAKTYGQGGTVFDALPTRDRGFLISGATNQYPYYGVLHLIKTDSLGDTLWSHAYSTCPMNQAAVRQTYDDGYIVAEQRSQWCTQGGPVLCYYKIKPNGDTSWSKCTFAGGPALALCADSGFLFAGYSALRTNQYGDSLWTKTYGSVYISCAAATADGGFILGGSNSSIPDFAVIKTDASGDTLWARTYGGPYSEQLISVIQTGDGGYLLAGITKSFQGDSTDIYLVKTDAQGDTLWTRTIGRALADAVGNIEQTADGGYLLGGSCQAAGNAGLYLVKTDSAGRIYSCNEKYIFTTLGHLPVSITHSLSGYLLSGVYAVPDSIPVNKVHLTSIDNCSIAGGTGMNESAGISTGIFPNPSPGSFTLQCDMPVSQVSIYDVLGNLVFSEKVWGPQKTIEPPFLENGVYVVRIFTGELVLEKRLVVSRH